MLVELAGHDGSHGYAAPALPARGGGDKFARGQFRKENFSPPPGTLKLAVISWCALDGSSYFLVGTFKILGNTAFQCIPVTQPLHVANQHIFVTSLCLVHCCTFLNSQCSPASESAVKLLVTRCENFAVGGGFSPFFFTVKFPREILHSP